MSKIRHQQRRTSQKKHGRAASLNLVSLMDIFTILVFFLMVNSSEVEVLQTSSKIKLPDSTSEQRPENKLVISISEDDLVLQGRPVASVSAISDPSVTVIAGLKTELEYQASRKTVMPEGGFEVTIMGDRELPYWLLKKVMLTCQTTDFARISLAVNKIEGAAPAPVDGAAMPETAALEAVPVTIGGAS
ncbi:MAG: biopolymer transporter ExbD [Pseudomonadales bacterium]|nr:biopolymer transporter ExbD [Pseudomonadales bacterium]